MTGDHAADDGEKGYESEDEHSAISWDAARACIEDSMTPGEPPSWDHVQQAFLAGRVTGRMYAQMAEKKNYGGAGEADEGQQHSSAWSKGFAAGFAQGMAWPNLGETDEPGSPRPGAPRGPISGSVA